MELAYVVLGAGNSEVCRMSHWARDSGRSSSLVQRPFGGRIPSSYDDLGVFVIKLSADCMQPTKIFFSCVVFLFINT